MKIRSPDLAISIAELYFIGVMTREEAEQKLSLLLEMDGYRGERKDTLIYYFLGDKEAKV